MNDRSYTNKDWPKIAKAAADALQNSSAQIGNLRISSLAIEFDLLLEEGADPKPLVQRLSSIGEVLSFRLLDIDLPRLEDHEWIQEGVRLFNEERFWECHEALEQVWRKRSGKEKELLQGIILTAAAFVHYQRDEEPVFISMLKRAKEKLEDAKGLYLGIDIDDLKRNLDHIVRTGAGKPFKLRTSVNALSTV